MNEYKYIIRRVRSISTIKRCQDKNFICVCVCVSLCHLLAAACRYIIGFSRVRNGNNLWQQLLIYNRQLCVMHLSRRECAFDVGNQSVCECSAHRLMSMTTANSFRSNNIISYYILTYCMPFPEGLNRRYTKNGLFRSVWTKKNNNNEEDICDFWFHIHIYI